MPYGKRLFALDLSIASPWAKFRLRRHLKPHVPHCLVKARFRPRILSVRYRCCIGCCFFCWCLAAGHGYVLLLDMAMSYCWTWPCLMARHGYVLLLDMAAPRRATVGCASFSFSRLSSLDFPHFSSGGAIRRDIIAKERVFWRPYAVLPSRRDTGALPDSARICKIRMGCRRTVPRARRKRAASPFSKAGYAPTPALPPYPKGDF